MPRKWLLISFKPVNKKTVTVSQFWLEEESENEILIQPINWWVFHHINVTSNIYQFIMKQNRIKDELLQTGTSVQAHIKYTNFFGECQCTVTKNNIVCMYNVHTSAYNLFSFRFTVYIFTHICSLARQLQFFTSHLLILSWLLFLELWTWRR